MDQRRRRVGYFTLMGVCLALFVGAWAVVRHWSVPAAVAMCVAAVFALIAARFVGHLRDPGHWWSRGGEPPAGR
ncbi:hypothetical protein PJ985_14010 [Streptomyces sp. ACA25]|uniref:hypothetical protein n=1 Tax=Streptomyces sp. ACA25 TaxID=3022596 RepID=UPI002307BF67|nr:hypothetical protein [Streptomyces sp. ACA25]MDB1088683.1 hypothetical protein [Streptomyces sp. ACA25]